MSDLRSKLGEIEDAETLSMVRELELIRRMPIAGRQSMMLLHYLRNCLDPAGQGARRLDRVELDSHDHSDEFVLRKKIGKVGTPLFHTLKQLAEQTRHNLYSIEHYDKTAVYTFINKMLFPVKRRGKPPIW